MRRIFLPAALLISAWGLHAQSGPTANPGALNFSYQVNSTTFPAAGKVTVTLPAASNTLQMTVVTSSAPVGWLTVTPDTGHSPLALTVTVNPTSLSPGSYSGTITVNTIPAGTNPAVVAVSLAITNPPSTLQVSSSSANYSPASGAASPALTFTYTTGTNTTAPASSQIDVSSTGDIIPFNVTASNATTKGSTSGGTGVWLRVSGSPSQLPGLATSGSAFPGSYVPIYVTLDLASVMALSPGSYGGSITIAASNAANGTATVSVNLVVSAGPPTVDSIFPQRVIAGPTLDPVITIYGDNFFSTSVVTLKLGANTPITLPSVLLSRKVLQATVKAAYLAVPIPAVPFPIQWTLSVTNPAPPNDPGQPPAQIAFNVDDPTIPTITSVVNAASYLGTSVWTGTGTNPLNPPVTPAISISPREIISIFGQNVGPAGVSSAIPTATPPSTTLVYPTIWNGVQVVFTIGSGATSATVNAPIIMTSINQINAIVPAIVATAIGSATPSVTITVVNGAAPTAPFSVLVLAEDPGAFTFGGLGQGQAAVLNYDSTGAATINSTKSSAVRGSAIAIFATGMGDLSGAAVPDGAIVTTATTLRNGTTRVDIDGQPAVVTYAGTSPGAVAGLVQVNAIVPPTVRTGQAITITVSIGAAAASHRSQPAVTLSVK